VQEYLANPLLINKKKFDLRVYVLVLNIGSEPLCFISDESMARFCTEPYSKPTSANMHILLSHLTNYSLNKMSDKYENSNSLD